MNIPAAFTLWPRGPLRFGDHPRDRTRTRAFPRSDTLFGALCWAHRTRFGVERLEAWIDRFRGGNPPLLLSSAMPILETGNGRRILLPQPHRRPPESERGESEPKRLKGIDWVDAELLRGDALYSRPDTERIGTAIVIKRPGAAATPDAIGRGRDESGQRRRRVQPSDDPWRDDSDRPRVAIDRVSGQPNLFQTSQAWTRREAGSRTGLGIAVLAEGGAELDRLRDCFDILARTGIGGERSIGAGGFDWTEESPAPFAVSVAPLGLCLSLLWPGVGTAGAALLNPPIGRGYRVVERSGWISSDAWHGARGKSVAMLAEGSYVTPGRSGPIGGLADVTPDSGDSSQHRVYRYGYGLFLDEGASQ